MIKLYNAFMPKDQSKLYILKKYKWTFLFICFFAIFFLRILKIDNDLPAFGLTFYQPMDEGLYSKMAINLYKNGSLFGINGYEFYTAPTYSSIFFANMLQYFAFNLFGNNYFSFRLPYLLSSCITITFLFKIIFLLKKQYQLSDKQILLLVAMTAIYSLIDFAFVTSSKVVENSSFRYMSISLLIYICIKYEELHKKAFLVSFITTISIFFIYFSNIFLLLPLLIMLFYVLKMDKKNTLLVLKYGLFGIICGLVIAEIYYLVIWNQEAVITMLKGIFDYGNRVNITNNSSFFIVTYIKNFMHFLGSNIFFYNVPFFIIGLLSFLYNLNDIFQRKNINKFYVLMLITSFILLTILTNDYYERKSIVIFPAIFVSIYYMFCDYKYLYKKLNNLNIYQKLLLSLFTILVLFLSIYSSYKIRVDNQYFNDFSTNDTLIIKIQLALTLIIILIFCASLIFKSINSMSFKYIFCVIVFVFFINNIYFSFKYIYLNNSCSEKQIMIDLGNDIGEQYIIGPYSYSYSLYNEIHPISNTNEKLQYYLENMGIKYYIFYSDLNNTNYLNHVIFHNDYPTVILYKEYIRDFQTFGYVRHMGLFIKNELH